MIQLNFSLTFGFGRPKPTSCQESEETAFGPVADFENLEEVEDLEHLEEVRQLYETFLSDLEALAVKALISGDWSDVYARIRTVAGNKTNQNFPAVEYDASAIAVITRILDDQASKNN